MSDYILGVGSKFYLGLDATTALTESDYVTNLTNLGALASEYNMIDVEPELDATTQERVPGLKTAPTFTVTGNLKSDSDNEGYNRLKTVHDSKTKVKFGIARPGGLDGIGGLCYVSKIEIGEATNEGVYTYSADIATTGELSLFELDTEGTNPEGTNPDGTNPDGTDPEE